MLVQGWNVNISLAARNSIAVCIQGGRRGSGIPYKCCINMCGRTCDLWHYNISASWHCLWTYSPFDSVYNTLVSYYGRLVHLTYWNYTPQAS